MGSESNPEILLHGTYAVPRILKFFVWKNTAWGPGPFWEAGGFSTAWGPNAALPLGMEAGSSLAVANSCRNEPFQIKDITTKFAPQEEAETQVEGSTLQLEFVLMGLNSHSLKTGVALKSMAYSSHQ